MTPLGDRVRVAAVVTLALFVFVAGFITFLAVPLIAVAAAVALLAVLRWWHRRTHQTGRPTGHGRRP